VGNNKLGSVGIAIRHGVAFHGLALNVAPDLTPFFWINPCGLTGVGVTSLLREGATDCSLQRVKQNLLPHLAALFATDVHPMDGELLIATFHQTYPV
jgi:lipoate-protein ligase B